MTLPRTLSLINISGGYYTTMMPVKTLDKLVKKTESFKKIPVVKQIKITSPARFELNLKELYSFSLVFSNPQGQNLIVGYDEVRNSFFIDRRQAGISDFNPQFAGIFYAPRIAQSNDSKITVILDNTSLELFADGGLTTITALYFPDQPYTILQQGSSRKPIEGIKISQLSSIWTNGK